VSQLQGCWQGYQARLADRLIAQAERGLTSKWSRRADGPVPSCHSGARLIWRVSPLSQHPEEVVRLMHQKQARRKSKGQRRAYTRAKVI